MVLAASPRRPLLPTIVPRSVRLSTLVPTFQRAWHSPLNSTYKMSQLSLVVYCPTHNKPPQDSAARSVLLSMQRWDKQDLPLHKHLLATVKMPLVVIQLLPQTLYGLRLWHQQWFVHHPPRWYATHLPPWPVRCLPLQLWQLDRLLQLQSR